METMGEIAHRQINVWRSKKWRSVYDNRVTESRTWKKMRVLYLTVYCGWLVLLLLLSMLLHGLLLLLSHSFFFACSMSAALTHSQSLATPMSSFFLCVYLQVVHINAQADALLAIGQYFMPIYKKMYNHHVILCTIQRRFDVVIHSVRVKEFWFIIYVQPKKKNRRYYAIAKRKYMCKMDVVVWLKGNMWNELHM